MSDEKEPIKPVEVPSVIHPDSGKVEIKYPKEPFEIGKTVVNGNIRPVFVDPKDFIRTGEQNEELAVNITNSKLQAAVELAVRETAARIEAWLAGVCEKIMPKEVFNGSDEVKASWLKEHNIYTEEQVQGSGRKILLKEGSIPISEFRVSLRGVVK